ncbi:MAG: hypothetical protein M3Z21_04920 [Pseudomonadota bacterium]|nr:hypothetical protein [Pseudomonadota bacterium]
MKNFLNATAGLRKTVLNFTLKFFQLPGGRRAAASAAVREKISYTPWKPQADDACQ